MKSASRRKAICNKNINRDGKTQANEDKLGEYSGISVRYFCQVCVWRVSSGS